MSIKKYSIAHELTRDDTNRLIVERDYSSYGTGIEIFSVNSDMPITPGMLVDAVASILNEVSRMIEESKE